MRGQGAQPLLVRARILEVIVDNLRKAELKWAKRCLYALVLLAIFALAVGMTVFGVKRSASA